MHAPDHRRCRAGAGNGVGPSSGSRFPTADALTAAADGVVLRAWRPPTVERVAALLHRVVSGPGPVTG
ncbi:MULTISPECIES: hypothetical protein [unclassified Pseudonocardia]|uniref:hypothetical protein n=1 Tax=unclassified Pseudonocardia TaxID=2619320 RepID=UPI0009670806|nr:MULTISPECIES: hypothetical protein [unclassified Pseudonocardia]MBN9098538.1 hypothetical protein [Pseudonocardia sp.]OJY40542.1 MAG: hypothetical protein BGP03_14895 [Pseudonocardia sp. 73-21]